LVCGCPGDSVGVGLGFATGVGFADSVRLGPVGTLDVPLAHLDPRAGGTGLVLWAGGARGNWRALAGGTVAVSLAHSAFRAVRMSLALRGRWFGGVWGNGAGSGGLPDALLAQISRGGGGSRIFGVRNYGGRGNYVSSAVTTSPKDAIIPKPTVGWLASLPDAFTQKGGDLDARLFFCRFVLVPDYGLRHDFGLFSRTSDR